MAIHTTPDSYTKLLIHSDTTDTSTTFVDSSDNVHTVTAYGNAHHEVDQSKFGATSMHFDGSGDGLSVPISDDFNFGSGDFTYEAWVYPTSFQGQSYTAIINNFRDDESSNGWSLLFYSTGYVHVNVDGTHNNSTNAVPLNEWSHVAAVRNGRYLKRYINGVDAGNDLDLNGVTVGNVTAQGPNIGNAGSEYSNRDFQGYIDEVRISKGIARWTDDFVPPNKPYSVIGDDSVLEGARDSVNFWGIRGGTHTNYNRYGVKTFTSSGTFTTKVPVKCDFLIVAGGGGGGTSGTYGSGGGGAGGLIYDTAVISPGSYTVTIGAGGAVGVSGDNTTFNSNTSIGGGHGGHGSGQGSSTGANGGSGGGSCYPGSSTETGFTAGIDTWSVGTAGGLGTAGQGNYGGRGESTHGHGSGGGGAGGKGWNYGYNSDYPTPNNGAGGNGHGGVGLQYSISGTATYYAGGGGGGGYGGYGNAGTGGGGSGGSTGTNAGASPASSVAGTPNTGGGGGGGMTSEPSSAGGSGIVVVRWEIL